MEGRGRAGVEGRAKERRRGRGKKGLAFFKEKEEKEGWKEKEKKEGKTSWGLPGGTCRSSRYHQF